MELTQRKLLILKAIIDEYINTGVPVGSRTLSKRDDMSISPATIRNEMADLEEMGYLYSPHTSAGRQPTERAYRLYVDGLMQQRSMDEDEAGLIRSVLADGSGRVEDIMNNTAKALSDATHLTSVVLAPATSALKICRVQAVKISGGRLLLLLVFDNGTVKDITVASRGWQDAELDIASEILTKKVRGMTLAGAYEVIYDELNEEGGEENLLLKQILDSIRTEALRQRGGKVILGGTKNILDHPEYRDVDSAKSFLALMETKEPLYELLSQATDMEFTIKIGKENDIEELKNMSVVTATYKIGDKNMGSFGVIGPTRMDYAKVLSVLSCVGKSMTEIMQCYIPAEGKEDN